MDMKEQTRNSVLTAMVCVALSSGTAWAAVPEVPGAGVQQSAGAAALAQASVADVVDKEKARKKAGEELSLVGSGKQPAAPVKGPQAQQESSSATAAKLHSMPLYWDALKPREEQVKKAQPIIITADDIEAKRKEEKRAAAAQAAKGAKVPAGDSGPQAQPPKIADPKPGQAAQPQNGKRQPAPVAPSQAKKQEAKPAPGLPVQPPQQRSQQQRAESPLPGARPQVQPAPQAQRPQAAPSPAVQQPVPQSDYSPPQPKPAAEKAPVQETPAAAPQQEKRQMVQLHPEGLHASRRQQPAADFLPRQPQLAYREEERPQQVQPQQPGSGELQSLPKQIQVERPPEYEGVSDEVVRHIMAGEYAMRYQLSRDPSEPGVYQLTQLLNKNTGLTHLQKIEYLMGFGRAINRSNLSEYQKKALIDSVIKSFDDK